jgi:hypothetical protein
MLEGLTVINERHAVYRREDKIRGTHGIQDTPSTRKSSQVSSPFVTCLLIAVSTIHLPAQQLVRIHVNCAGYVCGFHILLTEG